MAESGADYSGSMAETLEEGIAVKVTCKACGKRYNYYKEGCCPECGAFNRLPHREQVNADGTVHHISEEQFWEDGAGSQHRGGGKVCFEEKPNAPVEEADISLEPETESGDPSNTWSYEAPDDDAWADTFRRTGTADASTGERGDSPPYRTSAGKCSMGRRPMLAVFLLIFFAIFALVLVMSIFVFRSIHDTVDQAEHFWDSSIQIAPQREATPVEPERPEDLGLVEVDPIIDELVDVAYEAQIGDLFFWRGYMTRVETCAVEYLSDGWAEVTLEVDQGGSADTPDIMYITHSTGALSYGYMSDSFWNGDKCTYFFQLPDVEKGTEMRAVFTGFIGDEYVEIQVPLA